MIMKKNKWRIDKKLKIIDGVGLEILLKYGFERVEYTRIYMKNVYYDDNLTDKFVSYSISSSDRIISISYFNFKGSREFRIDDTIYDLIQDNLVEVVNFQ